MELNEFRRPLPMSMAELREVFGTDTPDFVIVSGDA